MRRLVVAILAAGAVVLTVSWTREFGFLGTDTYSILAASRVDNGAEFWAIFRRPLLELLPGIYRPFLNLSFALDHAMWDLDPFGYHLTDALLFGLSGGALGILAHQLVGVRSRAAFWVVPVVFFLHPSEVEVVPVSARRGELLCCLFLTLTLIAHTVLRSGSARIRGIVVAALSFMAIAGKESALIVPALVFAVSISHGREPWSTRLSRAMWATLPCWLAVSVMVVVRFAVLGRLGGHWGVDLGESIRIFPRLLMEVWHRFLEPQRVDPDYTIPVSLLCGAILAILYATLRRRRDPSNSADEKARQEPGFLAFMGMAWILCFLGLYTVSRLLEPQHFVLLAAGWAMLWGAAAERFVIAARDPHRLSRVVGALGLLAVLGFNGWGARDSPLIVDYPQYRRLDTMSQNALAALGDLIQRSPNGETVSGPRVTAWLFPRPGRRTLFGATGLARHSVQAWADMTFPGRRIRFEKMGSAARAPAADELVVLLP